MAVLYHKNISTLLQKKEPQLRSYLVKKMDFRRVPKIDFRPYVKEEISNEESAAKQAFLREQLKMNYSFTDGESSSGNDDKM